MTWQFASRHGEKSQAIGITPEALGRLQEDAVPGEPTGSEYSSLWALDGLGLREPPILGEPGVVLVARRIWEASDAPALLTS